MIVTAVAVVVVFIVTISFLFYREISKIKNSTKPLGYRKIDKSKIPKIKNRSIKDLAKDRYHPNKTKLPSNIDYIVVGSGIGGLSSAALLARCGRRVLVLEQHDRLGGCLHQFSGKFQFDTGIHYIGEANKFEYWLNPITSKAIKFVLMGNKDNGYTFDQYIIGSSRSSSRFNVRALTRKQDLLDQCVTDNDRKSIFTYFKLLKMNKIFLILIFAGKLINNRFLSKLLFKYAKWKYPLLWNKSINDIFNSLFSSNKRLGMNIFANIGDIGGKFVDNAQCMQFALFDYYKYGGYFINGGPSEITRSIIPIIESSGGRCLANIRVKNIIFRDNKAIGVIASPNKSDSEIKILCKSGVISAVGFYNTYTRIAPVDKLPACVNNNTKFQIKRLLNSVPPSTQHFHIFIGLNKSASELNFPPINRWYLLFDDSKDDDIDYDKFLSNFHADPLNAPVMGFLSFPSAKNPDYVRERPGRATAIIISEIPRYHFEKWKDGKSDARGDDYNDIKKKLADRLINELLFKYYPLAQDNIAKIEIGTALSAEHYLGSTFGESYGLSCSCNRYFDFEFNQLLKPKQDHLKGLYLAGQDIVSPGFGSAFRGGVWAAESILGYHRLLVLIAGRTLIKDLNKMDGKKRENKDITEYVIRRQTLKPEK